VIERLLAPNPSLYTGPGTNTYLLVENDQVLILDPGPVIDSHAAAIVAAVGERTPVGVVVTHTHPDHAPLANPLAVILDVPVFGFGPGPAFFPDIEIKDGASVPFGSKEILAVHTPGHTSDHLCFRLGETLFTGDHIMEGSTVIMEDASAYLESLYLVADLGVGRIEPGHGDAIDDAGSTIAAYIDHRLEREHQIVRAVGDGARTIGDIVDVVYGSVPKGLRHAAVHQVEVQVTKLLMDGALTFTSGKADEEMEVHLR
jgi:glyoxylase-like metal-dependent hydrolase (beta-lactamase superfamily II)